jgi:hypothetical protein
MEKNSKTEITQPIEGKRMRTSLNLQQIHIDGLSKIAKDQKITLTAMMDKALTIALSVFNNTSEIDLMLRETNGYIFKRDLERVKGYLSTLMKKGMTPIKKHTFTAISKTRQTEKEYLMY